MPSAEATPPPPPTARTPQLGSVLVEFQWTWAVLEEGSQEPVLPGLPGPSSCPLETRTEWRGLLRHMKMSAPLCCSSSSVRCSSEEKKTLEPSAVMPSKRTPSVAPGVSSIGGGVADVHVEVPVFGAVFDFLTSWPMRMSGAVGGDVELGDAVGAEQLA